MGAVTSGESRLVGAPVPGTDLTHDERGSSSAVAPDSESPDCWRAVICLRRRWPLANDLSCCTSRTTVATRSIFGRFASIDWSQISPRGDATLQTVPAAFPAWLTAHALAAVVLAIGVK